MYSLKKGLKVIVNYGGLANYTIQKKKLLFNVAVIQKLPKNNSGGMKNILQYKLYITK